MGELFLRGQAKGFQHRSAAHHNRLKIPTLITKMRADVLLAEYTCSFAAGADSSTLEAGAALTIHDANGALVVADGNRKIGEVDTDDAAKLREPVQVGGGLLLVSYAGSRPFGFFAVKIAEEGL